MSPELTQLLADAPQMEKFPRTHLIELGLAEGWPPELKQENTQMVSFVPIGEVIGIVGQLGIAPIEGKDELLTLPGLPYNELAHGGWKPVLEAVAAWRENVRPTME